MSQAAIRAELDRFIGAQVAAMDEVSRLLIARKISLADWQLRMAALSKQTNLAGGALEAGGWFQMGPDDFGFVGSKLRREYKYLQRFAEQIASGAQPLNGQVARRARLFGEQGRVTYYDMAKRRLADLGFTEERSILNPADHCEECVSEAARGYVPIGSLKPIGQRICRSNCKCNMEFRGPDGTRKV